MKFHSKLTFISCSTHIPISIFRKICNSTKQVKLFSIQLLSFFCLSHLFLSIGCISYSVLLCGNVNCMRVKITWSVGWITKLGQCFGFKHSSIYNLFHHIQSMFSSDIILNIIRYKHSNGSRDMNTTLNTYKYYVLSSFFCTVDFFSSA